MPARTVTSPARLNHAVIQPQPRPPRVAAQWYSPPAVGNADAIWPIVAATHRANRTTSGHPSPIHGPPAEGAGHLLRVPQPVQGADGVGLVGGGGGHGGSGVRATGATPPRGCRAG